MGVKTTIITLHGNTIDLLNIKEKDILLENMSLSLTQTRCYFCGTDFKKMLPYPIELDFIERSVEDVKEEYEDTLNYLVKKI